MARSTAAPVVRSRRRAARAARQELDLVPDLALELFAALDTRARPASPPPRGDERGRTEPIAPAL